MLEVICAPVTTLCRFHYGVVLWVCVLSSAFLFCLYTFIVDDRVTVLVTVTCTEESSSDDDDVLTSPANHDVTPAGHVSPRSDVTLSCPADTSWSGTVPSVVGAASADSQAASSSSSSSSMSVVSESLVMTATVAAVVNTPSTSSEPSTSSASTPSLSSERPNPPQSDHVIVSGATYLLIYLLAASAVRLSMASPHGRR